MISVVTSFYYSIFEKNMIFSYLYYPPYAALPLLLFTMDKRYPNALLRARVLVRDKKDAKQPRKTSKFLDKQINI